MSRAESRNTPLGYANYLATYISSPTKIEKLTEVAFGKGRAPKLHVIAQMRYEFEKRHKRPLASSWSKDSETHDGDHYVPESLLPRAKPRSIPKPKPRDRDYIIVEPSPEFVPPPDNPFCGMFDTGNRLIASVAHDFDITPEELRGEGRSRVLVDARSVVIKLLRMNGKSFPQIGKLLDRDHSSAIHAVENFDHYLKRNETIRLSYERHLALMEEARHEPIEPLQEAEAA